MTMSRYTFYCETCRDWMESDPECDEFPDESPVCIKCGTQFECGECGHPIYNDGSCTRNGCVAAPVSNQS